MKRRTLVCALSAAAALFATVPTNDAHACGGCFHEQAPATQTQTTVVTGHRMALSISPTQTVLWDQVQYSGSPADFAWVLPVKPGAWLEVATDAWFDVLDGATSARVQSPALSCSGGSPLGYGLDDSGRSGCNLGCSSSDEASGGTVLDTSAGSGGGVAQPPPVQVVHQGTAGPYETVTLHANEQGALATWLASHGYAIDADEQPIIDAYTSEGFDFIALRLAPGEGVQQMKPVRVISMGAVPTLPLRMVAAGTGPFVAITLFVIGEGRWETQNFPNGTIDPQDLSWSFTAQSSNYATVRDGLLKTNSGRTWLTSYALHGALLASVNPTPLTLSDGTTQSTIAQGYYAQGFTNGEQTATVSLSECLTTLNQLTFSNALVVDPCSGAPSGSGGGGGGGTGGGGSGGTGGSTCGTVGAGEIDAQSFACGSLDDLGVALTGMHPGDVWLTRLESSLPHDALADDLQIQAAASQQSVSNNLVATTSPDAPCPVAAAALPLGSDSGHDRRDRRMLLLTCAIAFAATVRRFVRWRFGRPSVAASCELNR